MQGSPFWQIETETGFMLVMGENIMTPICKTEEELDSYIQNHQWDLICLMILTLMDKFNDKPKPIKTPDSPQYDTDASGL